MAESNVKNRLVDLNNHLFEQMERLNDDELEGEKMTKEISRAKAMSLIASQIIGNARLALDAETAVGQGKITKTPAMLGMGNAEKK